MEVVRKDDLESVKDRFEWLLKESNLTAYKLAALTKKSQSTFLRILDGSNPRRNTVKAICDELGCDEDWFVSGFGNPWKRGKFADSDISKDSANVPYVPKDRYLEWSRKFSDNNFLEEMSHRAITLSGSSARDLVSIKMYDDTMVQIIPRGSYVYGVKIPKAGWTDSLNLSQYSCFIVLHRVGAFVTKMYYNQAEDTFDLCTASIDSNKFTIPTSECLDLYGVFRYEMEL